MSRALLTALLCGLTSMCGGALTPSGGASTGERRDPSAPTSSLAESGPESASVDGGAGKLSFGTFSEAARDEPDASVVIGSPTPDQSISADRAQDFKIALQFEHWPLGESGRSVILILDEFRPRALQVIRPGLRLSELVDEDRELLPGEHMLVALLARGSGETLKSDRQGPPAPFAKVRFWTGPRTPDATPDRSPVVIYNLPRGTYNGSSASQSILLDFYVLGARLAADGPTIRVAVRGNGSEASTTLTDWKPLTINGLASGDYTVSLELRGPHGARLAGRRVRAERTITVNRDAPSVSR
jgi:hypothetical protein